MKCGDRDTKMETKERKILLFSIHGQQQENKNNHIPSLNINGHTIRDHKFKSQAFFNYFCSLMESSSQ
jgi:hypothetical protein